MGTSGMRNRIIIEYKIKLQKMIEISQNIKTKTNLRIFNVIDSLFMMPSLLGYKFGLASELRKLLLITTIEDLYCRPLISP